MLEQVEFDVKLASRRFIEVRSSAGYTQETLAERLGVSHQTIKNYEKAGSANVRDTSNGDRTNAIAGMKVETLFKMASIFDVSADYLLGITETSTSDIDQKGVMKYTGLSEDSVKTLHDMKADIDRDSDRCADIGSDIPYIDWLNDLLDGFYLDDRLIAMYYIALRRGIVNGGSWYKNNEDGQTKCCDNISPEYACMKIGREVEMLLRRKYRIENSGVGGGYSRTFITDFDMPK